MRVANTLGVGAVAVVAGTGLAVAATNPFGAHAGSAAAGTPTATTASVTRQNLSSSSPSTKDPAYDLFKPRLG
jgi:hypothetical protein